VIAAEQRYLWAGESDYNTRGVRFGIGEAFGF
jgi:hypothetical protein